MCEKRAICSCTVKERSATLGHLGLLSPPATPICARCGARRGRSEAKITPLCYPSFHAHSKGGEGDTKKTKPCGCVCFVRVGEEIDEEVLSWIANQCTFRDTLLSTRRIYRIPSFRELIAASLRRIKAIPSYLKEQSIECSSLSRADCICRNRKNIMCEVLFFRFNE